MIHTFQSQTWLLWMARLLLSTFVFFLSILFTKQTTYSTMPNLPVPARERVNMATMVLPPLSTKSWQNMTNTRDTLAENVSR